jgi:hypothetical protein
LGRVAIEGKSEKVEVYEALDADPREAISLKVSSLERFDRALQLYASGDEAAARSGFSAIVAENAADGPAAYYLTQLCKPALVS